MYALALLLLAQVDPLPLNYWIRGGTAVSPIVAQFAATGSNMGTACSCAAVTGSGSASTMTATRASSATCIKGSMTTGIAAGDFVTCASDTPRMGTAGVGTDLKYLAETSRTNVLIQSDDWGDVVYSKGTSAGTATVVTNQADSPLTVASADRITFPACATSNTSSTVFQIAASSVGANTVSVYVKGVSSGGTIGVAFFDNASSTGTNTVCTYVADSWTRCVVTSTATSTGVGLVVGCNNIPAVYSGATNTGAADVYIAHGQIEAGTYATSYIPTTTVAVNRAADVPTLTVSGLTRIASTGGAAISIIPTWQASGMGVNHGFGSFTTNSRMFYYAFNNAIRMYDGTLETQAVAGWLAYQSTRLYSNWSDSTATVSSSTGTTASGTFTAPMTTTSTVYLGMDPIAGVGDAWFWDWRLCTNTTGCR